MVKSFNEKEEYLQKLFIKLEESFVAQEVINFKLVKAAKGGFKVKIGGLFGFISFVKMPWVYPDYSFWKNATPHLTGLILKGSIAAISRKNFSILVHTTTKLTFNTSVLSLEKIYKGVILKKAAYGFFIDIGISFSWLEGSLVGLMHKSKLSSGSEVWKEGDVVDCTIYSIENGGKIAFASPSAENIMPFVSDDELNDLLGSIQKGKVIIDKNGEKRLLIADKYLSLMPIRRKLYPGQKKHILELVSKLESNAVVNCLVLKANHRKKLLIVKFLPENVK